MAQKIITTYVDDLTGEESSEIATHSILIDGAGVEIDQSNAHSVFVIEDFAAERQAPFRIDLIIHITSNRTPFAIFSASA